MAESKSTEKDVDPVVKEIPVFFSKRLAEKLFIFKYPLRSAENGYDKATILKSAIKPENQDVQLEVELNTCGINYDKLKGEQMAKNANMPSRDDKEDEEKFFEGALMDKIVLQSTCSVPPTRNNLAVGVYQNGELHLTPVEAVVELRPAFHYFDKHDKPTEHDDKDEVEEEEVAAKEVTVTFAGNKPAYIKKMEEESFKHQTTRNNEEAWIYTKYIPATSPQAELTRMEMFCPSVDHDINTSNMSKDEYLKALLPSKAKEPVVAKLPDEMTSLNEIRSLPLIDQLRCLMKSANVLSFVEIRNTLSSDHNTETLLKYLQRVAVLVKGNWIANSELLYPEGTASHQNGVSAEIMCRARDFILLKFTQNEYLLRTELSSEIALPCDELTEILSHMAKHQANKGWHLIRDPDIEFSKRYLELAERQKFFWEAKQKHLQ